MHRSRGQGDEFNLLGLIFDVALRMTRCLSVLSREAGWRLQAILRPKRFFSQKQLINLYKCQVLSYIESGIPGYYHAAPSNCRLLDRVQERLLRELHLSAKDALNWYNLAPLNARRDIAILGLLYRIVYGLAPPQLCSLFPFQEQTSRAITRLGVRRHQLQLFEPSFRTDIYRRSLFGLIVVWNLLPQEVVSLGTIQSFQSALQRALKKAISLDISRWWMIFSPSERILDAFRFQDLFGNS